MEDKRWPQRIMTWSPGGRRRGWPEVKWEKEVERDMKQRNLPSHDAINRQQWRLKTSNRWTTGRPIFFHGATAPSGRGPPHYRGFTITLRHTTLGRTPLDEWSARCRDLYLTTHNTHNRQTFMPPAGFEPTIPANERPQTHYSDCAATGIGHWKTEIYIFLRRC
jgi:hypothetical protein